MDKKYLHSSKWGSNPQVPLAHRDEGHNVLDPVGVQVLQLDLIVVQQTLEEWVGRNCESTLVEEREGDDVAIGWCRRILMAVHKPLRRIGPPMEKTTLDEALHARMGNIGVVHEPMEDGGGCGEAKATEEEQKLQI